ncbi:batA protein [Candidatus Protochlamydia naegleriophila]|uniref:BatA protein n=1 Tax=Candidatus Protochlamydia naegleriophila TaxID=389348 RepID=A0A0U5JFC8_9BACT|nr:VWA domain-containing protein [Candidatus Protochlamydia naegleriophila]CUI17879.1 batA protein [Candidatus Protochlamydia naegleriophila]
MTSFPFTIDYVAFWILSALLLAAFLVKGLFTYSIPTLNFSDLSNLKLLSKRLRFSRLPHHLYLTALLFLGTAFLDPHFLYPKGYPLPHSKQPIPLPTEGIAIYLVVDQSGSMGEKIASEGFFGRRQAQTKMDLLKAMSEQFVSQRPSDLIGLIAFARIPRILSPLTLDHEAVLKQLKEIQLIDDPEENGTAIGYAIYKTAHLIAATRHFAEDLQDQGKPAYQIKNSIMVVLTDGFQDPSRLDYGNRLRTIELDEAATYAKSQGIHLYIINIDPKFSSPAFAPHRRQMQAMAELTGGELYLATREQDLQHVFSTIDRLEKSSIPGNLGTLDTQENRPRFSLYPYFIAIGLACFLAALFLETTLLRKFP